MKKINFLTIVILMGLSLNLVSQDQYQEGITDEAVAADQWESTVIRPLHISFITPLSTNGMESGEITNIFSLNIIAGYSGGLQGVEVAGFSNVIRGETRGLQIAGFSNTNRGNVDALQVAGFSNVALGETNGAQFAGFANVARMDMKAVQFAGFSNNSGSMIIGGQFAGFSNVCAGYANGIQAAGFSNVATSELRGFQVAGFSNYAGGMALGGQVAGFANVNKGDANGIQVAGFSNINTGDINGLQVSGFLNTAKKVDGVQLGFINVSDTIENGVGIGFLTIVRKGYRTLEISANETFYGNLSFKTGTERLYNIITLGATARNNEVLWGWGYGVGTMLPVSSKMKLNIDAVSYHVNEDVWFTRRLNSLNKLNLSVEYKVGNFMTVYGGPTWNVHVSKEFLVEGVPTSSSLVGWSTFDRSRNTINVKMYPGLTVGIRL